MIFDTRVVSDVIFIGPFDLAKSMNVEFGGEQHESAIAKVLKATKAAGKYAPIFVRCASGRARDVPEWLLTLLIRGSA